MNDDVTPNRRLAVVLHADAVGYTALMKEDEAATASALSQAMQLAEMYVTRSGGRIVGTAGDAFLAEFRGLGDAIAAAVDFQRADPQRVGDHSLRFRIGINLGEVIADGDNIFGDGVNLAARIQSLAPPGGIAVSDHVRTQLGAMQSIAFADGGAHRVRGLNTPLRIHVATAPFTTVSAAAKHRRGAARRRTFALAGAALVATLAALLLTSVLVDWPEGGDEGDVRPVVAALPFATVDHDETWFADGVTEDVIAHLGRFPELLVLSWSATAPLRGSTLNRKELGARLGADYLLSGSVRRARGALRLSVELSDASSGLLMWSERFETATDNIFDVQDQITGSVAGALALSVQRIRESKLANAPTDDLEAYDLVLRGRTFARRVERTENLKARAFFEEALARDPAYSDAHAGLAWTYIADAWWGWSEWPAEAISLAKTAAERALELDPRNVRATTVRAEALFLEGRRREAQSACEAAMEFNPNDASAVAMCGSTRIFTDDVEGGVALLELSLRIDPEPTSWVLSNLAAGYYALERYERAFLTLTRGGHGFDEDAAPHAMLAALNARFGHADAAREELLNTMRLYPFFEPEAFVRNMGERVASSALLSDLRKAGFH